MGRRSIEAGGAPELERLYAALDDKAWNGGRDGLLKLLILDACRAPVGEVGSPSSTSSAAGLPGFAEPSGAPGAMVIAFATAPGGRAAVGNLAQRNSLYSRHLLDHLGAKGETLEQLFSKVRQAVYKDSGHSQLPWENSSALDTFLFEPPLAVERVEISLPAPDDLVEVTVNGILVARTWREQVNGERWQAVPEGLLRPGPNALHVDVYNDKTRRNSHFWEPREGWHYNLRLRIGGRADANNAWSGGEDEPGGTRWGTLFPVLDAVLHVDPETGQVDVRNAEKAPLPP